MSKGSRGDYRSIPLEQWVDTLGISGARFISLQYGIQSSDIPENINLVNDTSFDPLEDLDKACAQVAAMDLIISIDNSIVHFAGAMGIETWVLLPKSPDWRWQAECTNSYWYDSVRLYRQENPRTWTDCLEIVNQDLKKWVKSNSS